MVEKNIPQEDLSYSGWKEEKDILLEYKMENLDDVKVANVLGMGLDNITRNQAVAWIMKMIEEGGVHHVITLDPYKLSKMHSNRDLYRIYNRADLHLAKGAGLNWASTRFGFPLAERIPTLDLIMDLIRLAEAKEYSIFFVGSKPEFAERAYVNIKKSFPQVKIVGRHGGFFNHQREEDVVEAMRKSDPDIIFVGMGFPKEDIWIDKIRKKFTNTVFISISGCIDIIAGANQKAPRSFSSKGLTWLYRLLIKPWKIGSLLRVQHFYVKVFFKSIFKKY